MFLTVYNIFMTVLIYRKNGIIRKICITNIKTYASKNIEKELFWINKNIVFRVMNFITPMLTCRLACLVQHLCYVGAGISNSLSDHRHDKSIFPLS